MSKTTGNSHVNIIQIQSPNDDLGSCSKVPVPPFERLLEGLSRQHQRILCLRVAGTSYVAIAAELGLHERTVRKVVERLALKDLARWARDDGAGDSF